MRLVGLLMFILMVLIIAATIILVIFIMKKEDKVFKENKRYGKAIIVGYASNSSVYDVVFSVRIPDLGDNRSHNLEGVYNVKKLNGKLDTRYPHFKIGDEVEVEYAPKKMAGIKVVDVRLRRELYNYPH